MKFFPWNWREVVADQSRARRFGPSFDQSLVWVNGLWVKILHRNKTVCSESNPVQYSRYKSTTCLRKERLLRFELNSTATSELNSTATSDCGAKKLGNDVWHDSESIATKICSQISRKRKAMFESHSMTTVTRDVVQPPVFVTPALRENRKKLALTWSRVCPSLPPVYNPAKHKICASPITRNVGPRSWFEYNYINSCFLRLCNPPCFLLYSVAPILPLILLVALRSSLPASRDIDGQVTAWKFRCPFSPYSLFPRQGTLRETNVRASRIVQQFKSAIWHRSATKLRDSQSGIKTLDDEPFGSRPLCPIFFICSDHVWNPSYWSQKFKDFFSSLPL